MELGVSTFPPRIWNLELGGDKSMHSHLPTWNSEKYSELGYFRVLVCEFGVPTPSNIFVMVTNSRDVIKIFYSL